MQALTKVARGFATWKIRHRRFATKKICHTTGETYACDREFERKRRTNVCNSVDVEDSPHNDDRLGSGGLGLEGLRSGRLSRGLGREGWGSRGFGVGGLGRVGKLGTSQPQSLDLTPPTSTPPTPTPRPQIPNPNSTDPNPPPTRPQPITVVWRIFYIGTVAKVCPMLTLKFSVTFVVWRIFFVANLPCGESSGNPYKNINSYRESTFFAHH